MKLGLFEIFPLTDGQLKLDGGAMFGVVPKTLWEKHHPADDRNQIRLELGVLLIKAQGRHILVDTGIGNKGDARFNDIYGVERRPTIEQPLTKCGLASTDITMVINTHFHFDHAGGNTSINAQGKIEPTFSRASFLSRGENGRMPVIRMNGHEGAICLKTTRCSRKKVAWSCLKATLKS